MVMKKSKEVFDEVLYIGPDINGQGGIASVLKTYSEYLPAFHYLPTNSRKGKLRGYFACLTTMMRIPFARMKGRRLIHVHYASGKSWKRKQIIVRWSRIWGYKIAMHCHGGGFIQFSKEYGNKLIAKALHKNDANIFLTSGFAKRFSEEFKLKNAFAVNNIVARSKNIHSHSTRFVDLNQGKTTLLYLGALTRNKGVQDLINAFAKAYSKNKMLRLMIGGTGPLEDDIKALIKRHGLEKAVTLLGWITGFEKDRAFKHSDIFVLPSYIEGMPISILEAMADQIAVIATAVGGIPDLITDSVNGLLVEPGDIDGIAAAILKLVDSSDLCKEIINHGADTVTSYYPENVAESLRTIYEAILQK